MFEIGVITKPQGIRGELRVFPTTDDPTRFKLLIGKNIIVRSNGTSHEYKLISARQHKNIVLITLDGVSDRNTAETLTRGTILISDDKALPLQDGEYFVRDLINLNVETSNGEHIGVISDVFSTNANDVYVINTPEGESFMIPAIKNVILNVDIAAGKMAINLMDGLRELKY